MHGEMERLGILGEAALLTCVIVWQVVCAGEVLADDTVKEAQVLKGHEGAVLDAVTSRDGQKLVSGGSDGTVRVWDLASKKELMCLKGHEGPVRNVVFMRDGSKLLSSGEDGTVRLWDATTGRQLKCFAGHEGPVAKMIVASDGRRVIVCGADGAIRVWPLPGPKRSWSAEQAAGPPNTPVAGDQQTAWASASQDGRKEWLLLTYEEPVKAAAVHVHETYNPGALTKVTVFDDDEEVTVWEGKDPTEKSKSMGVSKIPIEMDFAVNRVKLYFDSPNVRGWNEIDAVGLMDEKEEMHWAVEGEASSTYGQGKNGMSGQRGYPMEPLTPNLPPLPPVAIPANAVKVSHVDDTAEGKQSYGGSGFAVRFDRPESASKLMAIELFASRYGMPQPPNEDIHVYLLDEDFKVLHELAYPYRTFERGEDRWYALGVDSLEVPERFHVGFFFNAHQTKGVYMGKDTDVEESHSFSGTVERGYKPVNDKYDWMVRLYFVPGE